MDDWSVKDVLAFAREAGLDDEDIGVLEKQKVDGLTLQNKDFGFFDHYGMAGGAINRLLVFRDKFLHRMFTAIVDHVLLFAHVTLFLFFFIAERRGWYLTVTGVKCSF